MLITYMLHGAAEAVLCKTLSEQRLNVSAGI